MTPYPNSRSLHRTSTCPLLLALAPRLPTKSGTRLLGCAPLLATWLLQPNYFVLLWVKVSLLLSDQLSLRENVETVLHNFGNTPMTSCAAQKRLYYSEPDRLLASTLFRARQVASFCFKSWGRSTTTRVVFSRSLGTTWTSKQHKGTSFIVWTSALPHLWYSNVPPPTLALFMSVWAISM